jgi:hypothetical protein
MDLKSDITKKGYFDAKAYIGNLSNRIKNDVGNSHWGDNEHVEM